MILWEAVAALLVGGAVLWLVLEPLLRPQVPRPPALEPEDPLETRRGQSLAALKELDFDREMGKLSDEDYATLRATYTAEALAALRAEEPAATAIDDPAEALIARARGASGTACADCGPRPEPDARFCSECGGALGAAACAVCGAVLRPDARFCESCGTAAAA